MEFELPFLLPALLSYLARAGVKLLTDMQDCSMLCSIIVFSENLLLALRWQMQ